MKNIKLTIQKAITKIKAMSTAKIALGVGATLVVGSAVGGSVYLATKNKDTKTDKPSIVETKVEKDTKTKDIKEEETKDTEEENKSNIKEMSETYYVNTSSVNLREKNDANSEILATFMLNTDVTVVADMQDGWFKIQKDNKEGYIKAEYLSKTKIENYSDNTEFKDQSNYSTSDVGNVSNNANSGTSNNSNTTNNSNTATNNNTTAQPSYTTGWDSGATSVLYEANVRNTRNYYGTKSGDLDNAFNSFCNGTSASSVKSTIESWRWKEQSLFQSDLDNMCYEVTLNKVTYANSSYEQLRNSSYGQMGYGMYNNVKVYRNSDGTFTVYSISCMIMN